MLCYSIFSAVVLVLCIGPVSGEIEIGDGVDLLPTTRPERLLPDKKYKYYDTVVIDDPAERSAGIYFRISQRGVDYLANLTSEGLPEIFHRMVLPSISDSGLTLTDAVISEFHRPDIAVKFMKGKGLHISVVLTEIQVRGSAELTVFFATYRAQLLAVIKNLTVHVDVFIGRNLDQEHTNVTVTKCSVDPGNLTLQYFGQEASEFYTIGDLIENGITDGIRGKICALPTLVRDFVREKAAYVMEPPQPTTNAPQTTPMSAETAYYAKTPSFSDHLCSDIGEDPISTMMPDLNEPDDPEVRMPEDGGSWVPDLTLRYPPTFSGQDLVFGIDGGVLFNGVSAPGNISRPKFANVTIIRDQIPSRSIRPKFGIIQMLGLIVSEYVLNTMFYHVYDQGLGSVEVTYGHKNIPSVFQSMAKLACPDCKFIVKANLTSPPVSAIDRNGIVLILEGDVGIHFLRKNATRNLLSAAGLIRVTIKPHFRHSRLYSDIALAGVDFKVYRAGMSGLMAGAVRKIVSFLIPRAIWPKIQQRLRIAVNYKGIQIPRFCTVEPRRLHIDYVKHAAVITGDFDVDLPRLVDSFKMFMEQKLRHTRTKAELDDSFRYLRR